MATRFVWCVLALLAIIPFSFSDSPQITNISHQPDKWSVYPGVTANLSYPDATAFIVYIDKISDTIPAEGDGHSKVLEPSKTKILLGTKDNGEWWVHVRAKAGSKLSDTAHVKVKIDGDGPFYPDSFSAAALEDGSIKLDWSNAKDDLSGVSFYDIYRSNIRFLTEEVGGTTRLREFTIKDKVALKVASAITGNSFIDTNMEKGKGYYYHYKIVATDVAGNLGRVSPAQSVKSAAFCEFGIALDASLKDGGIAISVATTQNFSGGKITIIGPEGDKAVIVEGVSGKSAIDASYSVEGKINGDYNIMFTSTDRRANQCAKSKIFSYDTVAPVVKLLGPDNKAPLSGIVKLEASASEHGDNPSGIASVSFFMKKPSGEVKIGDAALSGGKYSMDWNTLGYENGRFEVAARAFDKSGNKGESVSAFSIQNTVYLKINAESAVADANARSFEAAALLEGFSKKGINVKVLRGLLEGADENLSNAKSFLASSEFELARDRSSKAIAVYNRIANAVNVEDYDSGDYAYNESQLDVFLSGSGLDKSLVPEAASLIKKLKPARSVRLQKVTVDLNSYYLATVEIKFTADLNSGRVKIVEPVPKKFVADAGLIFSASRFEVLKKDPVLVFYLDANSGKDVAISYVLNRELTKEQADALMKAKVWDLWVSPPILVQEKSAVKAFSGGSRLDLENIGLPEVKADKKTLLFGGAFFFIMLILFGFVIVAGVAAYYFFFRKKKGGRLGA